MNNEHINLVQGFLRLLSFSSLFNKKFLSFRAAIESFSTLLLVMDTQTLQQSVKRINFLYKLFGFLYELMEDYCVSSDVFA